MLKSVKDFFTVEEGVAVARCTTFFYYTLIFSQVFPLDPLRHLDVLPTFRGLPEGYVEVLWVLKNNAPWCVLAWKLCLLLAAVLRGAAGFYFRILSLAGTALFLPFFTYFTANVINPHLLVYTSLLALAALPKATGRQPVQSWSIEIVRYQFLLLFGVAGLQKLIWSGGTWSAIVSFTELTRYEQVFSYLNAYPPGLLSTQRIPGVLETLGPLAAVFGQLMCLTAAFVRRLRPYCALFILGFFTIQYLYWGWVFWVYFGFLFVFLVIPIAVKWHPIKNALTSSGFDQSR